MTQDTYGPPPTTEAYPTYTSADTITVLPNSYSGQALPPAAPPVMARRRPPYLWLAAVIVLVLALIAMSVYAMGQHAQVADQAARIATLQTDLDAARTALKTAQDALGAEQGRVATAASQITALETKITNLDTCAGGLVSTIQAMLDENYADALVDISQVKQACLDGLGSSYDLGV